MSIKISSLAAALDANLTSAAVLPVTDASGSTSKASIGQLAAAAGRLVSTFNPMSSAYGAVGDGVTDDTAALALCRAAAQAAGGTMYCPAGIYKQTTAFTITAPMTLRGVAGGTVFLFTGATDGVVLADGVGFSPIEGIEIRTTNAAAGSALKIVQHLNAGRGNTIRDVLVSYSGSGRWAIGGQFSNFQSSGVYNFQVYASATVSIHLGPDSCGALNFYDCQLIGNGGFASGGIQRGIEIDGTWDFAFVGGVIQGYYDKSLVWMTGSGPRFYGTHFENTNGTPSDGADVVATGANVTRAGFFGCQGGSVLLGVGGTVVRGCEIVGGEMGPITLSSSSAGCSVLGVRIGTGALTDNSGGVNTIVGCSDGSGNALANKAPGHFIDAGTAVIPAAVAGGALSIAYNAKLIGLDGSNNPLGLLFLTGGAMYLQYLATLNIRDTAGTQRATLSNSGANTTFDLAGAAAQVSVNGVRVLTARQAAITTPNAQTAAYVQADVQSLKTAIDAIRTALIAHGLTS